jgi:hypothetical protein
MKIAVKRLFRSEVFVFPVLIDVLFFLSSEYSYVLKTEATDSSITLVTMHHIA